MKNSKIFDKLKVQGSIIRQVIDLALKDPLHALLTLGFSSWALWSKELDQYSVVELGGELPFPLKLGTIVLILGDIGSGKKQIRRLIQRQAQKDSIAIAISGEPQRYLKGQVTDSLLLLEQYENFGLVTPPPTWEDSDRVVIIYCGASVIRRHHHHYAEVIGSLERELGKVAVIDDTLFIQ